MNKIAKFHKVDFEQFLSDWTETFENFDSQSTENIEALREAYNRTTVKHDALLEELNKYT